MAVCAARRLRPALSHGPAVSLLLAGATIALPVALVLGGRALGGALGPGLDETAARSLVAGLGLAAAAGGAALALAAPGTAGLGEQVRAAPVGRRQVVVATTVLPAALYALPASLLLLAVLVPVAAAAPGGPAAALPLALGIGAAGAAGAVVAEALLAAARGRILGPVAVVPAAVAWLLAGRSPFGPLGPAARALAVEGHAVEATAVAAPSLLVLAGAWVVLASRRPAERAPSRPRLPIRLPRGALPAVAVVTAARLARMRPLRRAVATTLLLAVGGGAVAWRAGTPAPACAVLAAGTASLGAALWPLAQAGLAREGRWLVGSTPVHAASAALSGALAAAALAIAATLAAAAPFAAAAPATLPKLLTLGLVVALAALAAGAAVPWRGERLSDQLASLAALAAALTAFSTLAGLAGRAADAGLPGPGAALVFLLLCAAVSAGAVTLEVKRP